MLQSHFCVLFVCLFKSLGAKLGEAQAVPSAQFSAAALALRLWAFVIPGTKLWPLPFSSIGPHREVWRASWKQMTNTPDFLALGSHVQARWGSAPTLESQDPELELAVLEGTQGYTP